MKKLVLLCTHLAVGAFGFGLGVYFDISLGQREVASLLRHLLAQTYLGLS